MAQPKDSAAMASIRAQLLQIQQDEGVRPDLLVQFLLAILDELKK